MRSENTSLTEWIEDEAIPFFLIALLEREADDDKQFETATSSADISLTVALLLNLVKHIYTTFIKPSAFPTQEPHTLLTEGENQQGQLGTLHIAGRVIVSLTEL